MKLSLAHTLRHYDKKNIGKDILAGLIIMAVSIPISMGYALIAGLPAVYGLYGSRFFQRHRNSYSAWMRLRQH